MHYHTPTTLPLTIPLTTNIINFICITSKSTTTLRAAHTTDKPTLEQLIAPAQTSRPRASSNTSSITMAMTQALAGSLTAPKVWHAFTLRHSHPASCTLPAVVCTSQHATRSCTTTTTNHDRIPLLHRPRSCGLVLHLAPCARSAPWSAPHRPRRLASRLVPQLLQLPWQPCCRSAAWSRPMLISVVSPPALRARPLPRSRRTRSRGCRSASSWCVCC